MLFDYIKETKPKEEDLEEYIKYFLVNLIEEDCPKILELAGFIKYQQSMINQIGDNSKYILGFHKANKKLEKIEKLLKRKISYEEILRELEKGKE